LSFYIEFVAIKDHEREQDLLSEPYLTRAKWRTVTCRSRTKCQ